MDTTVTNPMSPGIQPIPLDCIPTEEDGVYNVPLGDHCDDYADEINELYPNPIIKGSGNNKHTKRMKKKGNKRKTMKKKGNKRKTMKNKSKTSVKLFRKIRSKIQRGGGEQEDKNLFKAVKNKKVSIEFTKFDEVREALVAGAAVNAKDDDGRTALNLASEKGYTKIVAMLLTQEGINVNAKDDEGRTARNWASMRGRTEIVKMLQEYIAAEQRGGALKSNKQNVTIL